MKIGIVGLGLIGGSMAKAIKAETQHEVLGFDILDSTMKKARLLGAIDEVLTTDRISLCDMLILAMRPGEIIKFVKDNADKISENTIVLDCGGIKEAICKELEPIAKKHGFVFMGGHPMAGLEHSGFSYSKKTLFNNASMVLIPAKGTKIEDIQKVKLFCISIGFTNVQISTAKEHDSIIAFTSQLAHVVSSAYIKSPQAQHHKGFSAGSYKDMTRVAKLDENMWAELFIDNADNLIKEIDGITERLSMYSYALKKGDADGLINLLREGKEAKMIIDGEKF